MKKIAIAIGLVLMCFGGASAQDSQVTTKGVSISRSNENGVEKIHVKVEQQIDGESKTFEATYGSEEEMREDPEFQKLGIDSFTGGERTFGSRFGDHAREFEKFGAHSFSFDGGNGNFEWNQDGQGLRVETDENGNVKFFKDGEEISREKLMKDGWVMDEDGNFSFGDKNMQFFNFDGDGSFELQMNELMEKMKEHLGDDNMFFFDDESVHKKGDDGSKVIIKRFGDHDGMAAGVIKIMNIKISELTNDDQELHGLAGSGRDLDLSDLEFYPNPSRGAFVLKFRGEQKPTQIAVIDLAGKQVYSSDLNSFSGMFNEEIDLSENGQGMYLLKISQGSKLLTRKIVID